MLENCLRKYIESDNIKNKFLQLFRKITSSFLVVLIDILADLIAVLIIKIKNRKVSE